MNACFGIDSATYCNLGRHTEAIEAFKQAIRIEPDYAKAHYNLGWAYGKLGRYREAIDALQQVIRINPNYGNAHHNLGVAYGELGRHKEAIKAYKQAIRIDPDAADVHCNLGVAYGNLGRHREALDIYKRIIKRYPNSNYRHKAAAAIRSIAKPPSQKQLQQKASTPAATTRITGLRYWSSPNYTRIVIDTDKETTYSHRLLKKDPSLKKPQRRLYVDLDNSVLGEDAQKIIPINDENVVDIRAEQYTPESVRVVVDIESFTTYKIFSLKNPFRIVLDVWGKIKRQKQVILKLGPKFGGVWKDPATGMEFVWVPTGCFNMGSPDSESGRSSNEGPVHEVCVEGFWMGKYEVTNEQYRKFKSGHNSKDYKGHTLNGDTQPAVYVDWNDAKAFAKRLTRQSNNRFKFRLPTEAEWEYAARAGTTTARYWGDDPNDACQYANVHDQTSKRTNKFDWTHHNCDDGYAVTAPVGSFQANAFGLHDMLGNVWEWCEDIYSKDAYGKHQRNNPIYTGGGSRRVVRGGCCSNGPGVVRSADRYRRTPGYRDSLIGFRLLRTPLVKKPAPKVASIDPKYREIGRDNHYIAYANGVVLDTKTGLEWLVGPDKDTSWGEAKKWIDNLYSLSISGGKWQMPTINELKTLYEEGRGSRNMTPLLKTTGHLVWSGETIDSSSAWYFRFYQGSRSEDFYNTAYYKRAFAVRSRFSTEWQKHKNETKKYTSSSSQVSKSKIIETDRHFIKYSNGTVKDTETGLMWAAKDNGGNINWIDAKRYCENYRGGGYTDWRMPTLDELAGLYNKNESYQATQRNYNVHLTELIELSSCCPWASETRGFHTAYFGFYSGNRCWGYQSTSYDSPRALPVRSGK